MLIRSTSLMRFPKIFTRLVKRAKAPPLPPVVLTTSPIARLPDELIESIFELLPSSWDFHTERSHALAPCLLVCTRFHRLARPLVWRHDHLSSKRDVESVFLSEGQVILQSTVALSLYEEGTTADAMTEEDVRDAFGVLNLASRKSRSAASAFKFPGIGSHTILVSLRFSRVHLYARS